MSEKANVSCDVVDDVHDLVMNGKIQPNNPKIRAK